MSPILLHRGFTVVDRKKGVIVDFQTAVRRLRGLDQSPTYDWQAETTKFLSDLRVQERQARTLEGHESELRRYKAWLDDHRIDWTSIASDEIDVYVRLREHLSFSSRASVMTTLRVFYRWCEQKRLVESSPASHLATPKRPAPAPKSMNVDEVRKLLIYLQDHQADGLRELRDRALMLTGLYTGFRASELARSVWGWYDIPGRAVTIPISKMQRGRTVKMHPDLVPILEEWGKAQGLDRKRTARAFSLDGEPIVAARVGKVARRYAKLLDIPLTAHVLRHTFATWSLRKSGNLYAVSKALGHARLAQTEVYLRTSPDDSDPAISSLPGPEDW